MQKKVFQLIVLEVRRAKARPLLEHQHRKACLRQLARHDAAGGARADHDEIHGFSGFEGPAAHVCFSEYGTKPAYSRS